MGQPLLITEPEYLFCVKISWHYCEYLRVSRSEGCIWLSVCCSATLWTSWGYEVDIQVSVIDSLFSKNSFLQSWVWHNSANDVIIVHSMFTFGLLFSLVYFFQSILTNSSRFSCFWHKGWNLFCFSPLEKRKKWKEFNYSFSCNF